MKALVTGSAGFIGRHISRELQERGFEVHGSDLVNTARGAIEIFETVVDPLYDLVVHCAYNVGGRAAIDGVNNFFSKNLQLDASLFEWAVRTKQKHVLYFSSSAVYPTWRQKRCPSGCSPTTSAAHCQDGPTILSEDMYLGEPDLADANYGYAKAVGERLVEDARRNGLAVSVVRPFSGYSESQSMDYPFPSILSRAKTGDLSVWGPVGQTRDWIHIDDVVRGSLAVVESGTTDPVNLCTGRGVEMGALMRMAYAMSPGMKTNVMESVKYLEDKPTGVFYRVGDPTRMNKYYTAKISLEEGIQRALRL